MKKLFCMLLVLLPCLALAEVPAVTSSMSLDYATHFAVDTCEGGYQLITILDDKDAATRFLTIPEGAQVPANLDADVTPIQLPITDMLISSTPTMSLINAIGGLDAVRTTTTEYDTWQIPEVKAAMDAEKLTYVGAYKAPDFELLMSMKPSFSVFSTMLLSVPDVADKLTELEIPYLLDESTYENHPLARTEWVKLYGTLLGKEEEANAVFNAQKELVEGMKNEASDKTVAMFYITSKGDLYARNGGDYMAQMVSLAGGNYILADMNPEKSGTQKMDFESFYAQANQADLIIYIWNLGGKPATMADFLARNELLGEFKAVKEGNVWCTTPDYFQISNTIGSMIVDINKAVNAAEGDDAFTYLWRLK